MQIDRVHIIVPYSNYRSLQKWEEVHSAPLEGAVIASTVLRLAGYHIECHDLRFDPNGVESLARRVTKHEVVCIAGAPDGYCQIKDIVKAIKLHTPEVPIILGGSLATISWMTVMKRTRIDYCFIGECEVYLPRLLNNLRTGCSSIGLPVAIRDGEQIIPPKHQLEFTNVNIVPSPEYTSWGTHYESGFPELICYSTQRGCRQFCTFCANPWKGTWRSVQSNKILTDLQNFKNLGVREIWFNDPTFNTEETHSMDVAAIMSKLELPWACSMRATPVSSKLLNFMRDTGCVAVFLGIESGNNDVLRANNKDILVADSEKFLSLADHVGLPVVGFLVLGLPGETESSLKNTVDFVKQHRFIPRSRIAVPYPGTNLFELYAEVHKDRPRQELEEHVLILMAKGDSYALEDWEPLPGVHVSASSLACAMDAINAERRE